MNLIYSKNFVPARFQVSNRSRRFPASHRLLAGLFTVVLMCFSSVMFAQTTSFETAAEAVANMGVGWNMGNTLEANDQAVSHNPSDDAYWGQQGLESETCWGQAVTKPELIRMMKEAGFGAIRVPVTWYNHIDKDGKVDAAWMQRVHEVVDYVINQDLYCIINVHHDTGADGSNFTSWIKADESNYNANKSRYEYLWKQIAEEFKDYGEKLLFEGYNEMLDIKSSWCFASFSAANQYDATIAASAYSAINKYAQSFVNAVRSTGGKNTKRNLIVNTYAAWCGSGNWNTHLQDPLKEMKKPAGESNHIIFEVHDYPNISNLSNAKSEVNSMMSALNTHLVAQGVPVIFGEWGTSNVDNVGHTDYDVRKADFFDFVSFFIKKCKENNMATFYWMGLSDGSNRSLPVFNQPDLAEVMIKAYHGTTEGYTFPTRDDLGTIIYEVTFNSQWSELNLCNGSFSTTTYPSIELELEENPAANAFQIKVYGGNGKEHVYGITSAVTTMPFSSVVGTTVSRITLQSCQAGNTATVKSVNLIKADGTKQKAEVSVFWGCTVTETVESGIEPVCSSERTVQGAHLYNLSGQRVLSPAKGIYIQGGKKFIRK